ncbi:MAG: carboxypeptidase regulatory-like domain-containing protein [Planctomycetes bacterium]|nr:carboxypeptidase regulatory-like domain-containing protein [Planctomycetota bacterium]
MNRPLSAPSVVLCILAFTGELAAQVTGTVFESGTGNPIPGAVVTLQTTKIRTETAADGSFSLPVAGSGLTVVAAHKGYYNRGVTVNAPASVILQLDPVQVGNNSAYLFVDPMACGVCHPNQLAEWSGSPMAAAGTNTWVYDLWNGSGTSGGMGGFVYTRDSMFGQSHPDSDCAACHQPEPWVAQPYSPLEPFGSLSPAAMHGVSCDICHKIADVDESKMNFPGIYPSAVVFNRPAAPIGSHQVMYGFLGDVTFHIPGTMRASFQPQLAAAVCGVCHQDKNDPDADGNFEEPNGIVSEPTYQEWLDSPYGDPNSTRYRSCVDCHMPPSDNPQVSPLLPLVRDPSTVRSHRIEGTTPRYLENAVDLHMAVHQGAGELDVVVDVVNGHTGHHVPTGVTSRNVVLIVEAWVVSSGKRLRLVSGPVLPELAGVGNPDQGYFASLPGRIFGKVAADPNGNAPTFFTDAASIVYDSRIPADAVDSSKYRFKVPQSAGQVSVRARLLYRRAWRALVDQKQWTIDGHGRPLQDVMAPTYGHLMEEQQWWGPGVGPVVSYGTGCGGLDLDATGIPFSGGSGFELVVGGASPASAGFLWVGSDDGIWGSTALPLDLSLLGAPSCWLLASVDGLLTITFDSQGEFRTPIALPHPHLIGARFFIQAAAPAANSLGLVTSNALSVTVQR